MTGQTVSTSKSDLVGSCLWTGQTSGYSHAYQRACHARKMLNVLMNGLLENYQLRRRLMTGKTSQTITNRLTSNRKCYAGW